MILIKLFITSEFIIIITFAKSTDWLYIEY
jgi:hypothetical protein